MKLKIKKNLLLNALNDVSKALSSKNIIPILSGIKFELYEEKLVLIASDNDITIKTILEKSEDLIIEGSGSVVIKGKYILDIVRKLNSSFINIEILEDHKILIYNENSNFNLNGIDANEYPDINLSFSPDVVNMNVSDFKSMINQTNYACSLDEARVVLTGVNFSTSDNVLECSATDSYRLAIKKIDINGKLANDFNIIIPSKNLNELLKVLPNDDISMEIHIFNNKILFRIDNLVFQSRLINGTYPNTKNLIPNETLFDLKINKNELYDMVDRASILNNDKDNNVITLELNNKLLKITSMSLEIGKVEEKMETNCDENIKISFSGKYMLEALRTLKSENVILTFVGEIKPILLKEEDNDKLLCLILPIRTY